MTRARTLGNAPMPARLGPLPRDKHGYPIPWFVATLDDGTQDFRIAATERKRHALRFRSCWVCGQTLGQFVAFPIGPMCMVNRISADPPCHVDCADYAAAVCPFLATPQMQRREGGMPDDLTEAPGVMLTRNPGVTVVWVTRTFVPTRAALGGKGVLCRLGEPTDLHWWSQGRAATRAEIMAAMESGLPILKETCQMDDDPEASRLALAGEYQRALDLIPATL